MTGHFTSYETRTDHELATGGARGVAPARGLGQDGPVPWWEKPPRHPGRPPDGGSLPA